MGILGQGASRHLAHNQHTESLKTSGKLRIPPDWQPVDPSKLTQVNDFLNEVANQRVSAQVWPL
jgi:hypothetical protein